MQGVAPTAGMPPRRGRLAAALAALAVAGAFLLPQDFPLEWAPLNAKPSDTLFIEATLRADRPGDLQVYYNATDGIFERNSFRIPLAPATDVSTTYIVPLPDAPILEFRLDPIGGGAIVTVQHLRVVDRRGEEKIRFTPDMFTPLQGIASITPVADGWKITSEAGAEDPFLRVELPYPVLAYDLNHRNLLRCLRSTGYLAGMLLLLLLALHFAFERPKTWRKFGTGLAYLVLLAVLFSAVGNRGLIRNSLRYARFEPPPVPAGTRLELDLETSAPSVAQLFWDTGQGFNEAESRRIGYQGHAGLQTLRFEMPAANVRAVRFDPLEAEGTVVIRGVRVVGANYHTRAVLPVDSFRPAAHIAELRQAGEAVLIRTAPGQRDPITELTPAAVAQLNATLAVPAR